MKRQKQSLLTSFVTSCWTNIPDDQCFWKTHLLIEHKWEMKEGKKGNIRRMTFSREEYCLKINWNERRKHFLFSRITFIVLFPNQKTKEIYLSLNKFFPLARVFLRIQFCCSSPLTMIIFRLWPNLFRRMSRWLTFDCVDSNFIFLYFRRRRCSSRWSWWRWRRTNRSIVRLFKIRE